MESRELLELMDEIRKRIPVSFREAKAALEDNGYDITGALVDLEESGHRGKSEVFERAGWFFLEPVLTLRRKGEDLIVLSPLAATGLLLAGTKRPRWLLLSAAAVLFSGTDILIRYNNRHYSLQQAVSKKSQKAAVNVQEMKGLLDDRLQDMKETGFRRETQSHGRHYYTFQV